MDERALNELLECSVCLDRLDHTSKVLPCQHTFCRRCLEEIISAKNELRCPECRTLVESKVEDLPTNILLVRLLEGLKAAAARSENDSKRSGSCNGSSHSAKSNPKPCARALYNYDARESGDLTFKKGDTIFLRRQVDENWLQGDLGSHSGFFPASYVQVIHPLPPHDSLPKCRALYDFEIADLGEGKDCLFFKKDDVVDVIRRVDDNWAEGRLGERIGIFPLTFVEMNDAAKLLLSSKPVPPEAAATSAPSSSSPSCSSPPAPAKANSLLPCTNGDLLNSAISRCLSMLTASTCTSASASASLPSSPSALTKTAPALPWQPNSTATEKKRLVVPAAAANQRRSLDLDAAAAASSSVPQQPTAPSSASSIPATAATLPSSAMGRMQNLPPIYLALYSYKPQKSDELELLKGQYYTVAERCQDGWYKGTCLKSGITGVFPGNYVQQIKLSPSKNTNTIVSSNSSQPSRPSEPRESRRASSKPETDPSSRGSQESRAKASPEGDARPEVRTSSATQPTVSAPATSLPQSATTEVTESSKTLAAPVKASVARHNSSTSKRPSDPMHSSRSSSAEPVELATADRTRGRGSRKSRHRSHAQRKCPSATAGSGGLPSGVISPLNVLMLQGAEGGTVTIDKLPKERKSREVTGRHLVKKLGNSKLRRSRTPPPETTAAFLSTLSSCAPIQKDRSSSVPSDSESLEDVPVKSRSHRKTSSLDSAQVLAETSVGTSNGVCEPCCDAGRPSRSKLSHGKERYRCVVPYPSQSDLELDLVAGDLILVHSKREDGWFRGTLQRTGKTGLFPSTFVTRF